MADPRECPALQAGPVSSVVEVLDRLTEIRDGTAKLAPECGIAEFSDLYRTITQGISDRIEQGDFFKLSGTYDVVFSAGVIEHFEDPSVPLAAFAKLVRPGAPSSAARLARSASGARPQSIRVAGDFAAMAAKRRLRRRRRRKRGHRQCRM